jgi:hypothetical protein
MWHSIEFWMAKYVADLIVSVIMIGAFITGIMIYAAVATYWPRKKR